MLDVVDGRGERALELRHHAAGHFGRWQAGILPKRRNHRDADFRKDVDGRARGGQRADDEKQQRKHNESVRAPQGNADQGRHEAMAPQSAPRPIAVDAATYHPRQRQISTVHRNILAFPAHTTHKYVEVLRVVSMAGRSGSGLKVNAKPGERPDREGIEAHGQKARKGESGPKSQPVPEHRRNARCRRYPATARSSPGSKQSAAKRSARPSRDCASPPPRRP